MVDSSLILKKQEAKLSDEHIFGSYNHALTAQNGIAAEDHVRLDEIGIHTTDVINAKKLRSPKFYEHDQKLKWSESYHGRLGLRAVSRGVVSTAVYAAVQIYAGRIFGQEGYSGLTGDGHSNKPSSKNVLQWVAYGLDQGIGRPIKNAVYGFNKAIGKDHENAKRIARAATEFRRNPEYKDNPNSQAGRSLGVEMVAVTTDFAAMSATDYMTRYTLSLFDKNNKTAWVKDGHLDIKGGLKEVRKNMVTAVTYAAGQDMFTALPYVYYMKFQRHFLNKLSPGFRLDSEFQRHGGTLKVKKVAPDKDGKEYKIVGDYNLEGIIEYTGRFTFYNIITKMYRDLYVNVQEKFHKIKDGIQPPSNPEEPEVTERKGFFGSIAAAAKYLAVTTTKVSFFMIPSAFLFGTIRASQGKHRTFMISDEVVEKIDPKTGFVSTQRGKRIDSKDVIDGHLPLEQMGKFNDPAATLHDKITNPIARFSWRMSKSYGKAYEAFFNQIEDKTKVTIKHKDGNKFARRWAEGALAYTPYIMASSDAASQWFDTNRSNFVLSGLFVALGEQVKSLASFNGSKIKSSAKDVKMWSNEAWLAINKKPSMTYEGHIQTAMNDDNYKASNLGFELDKDRYEGTKHIGGTVKGTAQRLADEYEKKKKYQDDWVDQAFKNYSSSGADQAEAYANDPKNQTSVPARGGEKKFTETVTPRKQQSVTPVSLMDRVSSNSDPILSGRS